MRYYVKNKMVSFTGSSSVLDEQGREVYQVKGRVFSPTHKKTLCDLAGNPLFTIRNKYFTLFHKQVYIYDNRGGQKRLLCRVRTGLFGNWKVLDNAVGLELSGRFWDGIHAYIDGREVGKFFRDRNFTAMFVADAFTLEVYDEALAPFLIALVVGYDNIRDQQENEAR